jgi:hypothetical protein
MALKTPVFTLFREQIAKRGPITLTHSEIIRLFLALPVAGQPVLQRLVADWQSGGVAEVSGIQAWLRLDKRLLSALDVHLLCLSPTYAKKHLAFTCSAS